MAPFVIADDIFRWARETPDKLAISQTGLDVSYGEFAAAIRGAANVLHGKGVVGPGIAGIAIHRLLDFWIASLALRLLGLTTYELPDKEALFDPRLQAIKLVVSRPEEEWPGLGQVCSTLGFRHLVMGPAPCAGVAPKAAAPGGHLLRTSGTTGTFKLLLMSPEFEEIYHAERRRVLGIDGDTVFQLFDFAAWTGVGYKSAASVWAAGGSVLIYQRKDAHEALRDVRATHAALLPETLARVLSAPEGSFPRNDRLQLSLTGGTVTASQVEEARRRITPKLFNRLSSSEASIFGFTPLDDAEERRWHRPVPGRRVEIVDPDDRLMATGETGLLRVKIDCGPTSYFNDPELSRTFFRDGFFYTGDLAVMREDGHFALQGRATEVLNIRGQKISPAPIEEQLAQATGLSGICLLSMQDDKGDERLHAVIEGGNDAQVRQIRDALAAQLKVDDPIISQVEALPRTETGKLMRQSLARALQAEMGKVVARQ